MTAGVLCMVRYRPHRHVADWQQQTACTRAASGLFLDSFVMLDAGLHQSAVFLRLPQAPAWTP